MSEPPMSNSRYPRDPFDQSQYRQSHQPQEPQPSDPYGQEDWMLDPYAQGPESEEQPFEWGGTFDDRQQGYDHAQQYAQPGTYQQPAPPTSGPPTSGPPAGAPPGPPPAYGHEQGYQQDWQDAAYRTGGYETGAYQSGAYQTGDYQTGDYQTGAYEQAYETGAYQTGRYGSDQYETGQYQAYQTGEYDNDDYLTGAYDTEQFNQYAADQASRQAEPEAWPTAAEMRGEDGTQTSGTGAVPVQQAILRRVRRQRGRGFDATVLAAVVLVVVTVLAMLATRPHPWKQPTLAAHTSKPQSATAMCPAKPKRAADSLDVANAVKSGSGPVKMTGDGAGKAAQVDVSPGRLAAGRPGPGAVVLKAGPEVAAGLVAGRSTTSPLAAVDCGPPQATAWFSGVGAGAGHDSILELTNPNSGSATVDVALFDDKGAITVPDEMRGIAIPGNSTRTFDLLHEVPREGTLAMSTTVVRGQIGATVRDRAVDVVSGAASEDWMPGQAAPATTNRLVGLPRRVDEAQLTVANPSDDQVHVTLKLMTPQSILAPQGAPALDVPPHGVATADLANVLGSAGDAYGLQVDASAAVTAGLRTVDNGDVSLTTPAEAVSGQTALVLPTGSIGSKKVAIGSESGSGSVTITALNANGRKMRSKTVKVGDKGGAEVDIPAQAALVQLAPSGVTVHAAVVISGNGDTVVPFRPLRTVARSAGVAPGLPMPLKP